MKINDNGTDRNMTEIEETVYLAIVADNTKEQKAQDKIAADKAAAKAALLIKLGITADEAALLTNT